MYACMSFEGLFFIILLVVEGWKPGIVTTSCQPPAVENCLYFILFPHNIMQMPSGSHHVDIQGCFYRKI